MTMTKHEQKAIRAERLRREREQRDERLRAKLECDAAYRRGQKCPDILPFNSASPEFVKQIFAEARYRFAQQVAENVGVQAMQFAPVMTKVAAAFWDRFTNSPYISRTNAEAIMREDVMRQELVFDFYVPAMQFSRRVSHRELIMERGRR